MTSLLVAGLCALLVAGQHASGRRRAEQQPTSLHRWLICSQSCQTADALYGACEPAHRCPDHRLRASSFVTLCELGLGHQAVCCPWVRQERVHQHELIQCGRLCATDRSKRALYGTCLYRDECPANRRRLVGRLSACTSAGFRGRVCCPFQPPVLVAKNQLNITHLNGLKSTSPFDNRASSGSALFGFMWPMLLGNSGGDSFLTGVPSKMEETGVLAERRPVLPAAQLLGTESRTCELLSGLPAVEHACRRGQRQHQHLLQTNWVYTMVFVYSAFV
ncbi:hypothetical protein FJT64_008740 [Amphibalanus amphitrite]|uniref:Uncharacterized protein n=1 Tax=Amphibalanus amphitrite TaxID=1232801 RepID=A0A6A4VIP2_AMPAM|nr:hypothetical protein FJT64_008740 [Amphibalanus amphitrite]